jgi:hypothetical protein
MRCFQSWLLQQMNARDAMDGVVIVIKLAAQEFGPKKVASELHELASCLEEDGELPGWKFPE